MRLLAAFALYLFLLSACTMDNKNPEDLLASAFGNKLYKSDLNSLITTAMTPADSVSVTKKHVDKWLMQEMLFHESKQKIKTEDDIKRLVESYKKSLYILELEKLQLSEQLDTSISSAELDTFYNQHKEDFLLDEGIVKLLFVKVPESTDNEKLQTLWKTENIPALRAFVKAQKGLQLLDLGKWYYLSEIKNLSPPDLIDKISFNKTESYSIIDNEHKFLIKILDYTKANEIAPKSFAIDKIRLRLLHDRSTNLINTWKKELYQNNIQSKSININ